MGSVAKFKFSAVFTVEQSFNEVAVEQVRCVEIYYKAKQLENQSLKPADVTQKLKDVVYRPAVVSGV